MDLKALVNNKKTFVVYKDGCKYCEKAEKLLKKHTEYERFNQNEHPELVNKIKEETNHKTYPMIYIKGTFIGGSDSLDSYFKAEMDKK